ncbi:MAG: hypothetical protein RR948_16900 [Clostridium sp.]|uniref:hypothetical protein n=1 Tax=Clostridium sp. TaxID=1506 RepID=UPI003029F144
MIANKIKPKLLKSIAKFGVVVEVYRIACNEFNESEGNNTLVTTFKGLYSESNHAISESAIDGGKIKKDKAYKLIALIDDDSNKLLEGDFLHIKGIKFELISISNANMLDVYCDLTLRRC